ncbi:MAG: 3-deoxy-7-phosphoheptulonate synthase [Phycisphaerae bacterium]|nr:MAG: 3-deoxy-7-phosphoheptulonate synthase [Planctomycetota bacterium]KAB2944846.1 MAG: 3-deoxy-7-phosphoheptulonate synthase [Phycisphaerae bacterium]MBE7456850.1 3-deoxy-7-phosphoheptulonate synthase [Planctomycetia bacterium]MCK6464297.1 3-deoxy-7-phosphoheptulonate synthase [Phycisphaerae bacterium]MCL4717890.1 3-deoxy-7-phosphoheptulonate synthase [Phycisphaerae bacterium]
MLVVMNVDATTEQIDAVCAAIRGLGFTPHPMPGAQRTAVCVTGNQGPVHRDVLASLPGVREVISVSKPYKLVSRETHAESTVVRVGGHAIGGGALQFIAGPCSVESEDRMMRIAEGVAALGVPFLRAGAYKPRTSPYAFQGLEQEGLRILDAVRRRFGLRIVTEVLSEESVEAVASVADVLQIGARNMQNFALLKKVARCANPVLLKRGASATVEEWLMAAEYLLSGGNRQVILCERGIRTFSDQTRNTLDVSAIAAVKALSHLPVVADPSHAAGRREFVAPLARAAVAAGADGLIIEAHFDPNSAWSDGAQTIDLDHLAAVIAQARAYERLHVEENASSAR